MRTLTSHIFDVLAFFKILLHSLKNIVNFVEAIKEIDVNEYMKDHIFELRRKI